MKLSILSWFGPLKNIKTEVLAGITNFMAIVYIVVVNPLVMNANGHGFPVNATITATVITIIVMTIFVGLFVKLPFAVAPGMGFNAILTYNLVIQQKLPISIALGVIFWANVLFLVLALSGVQKYLVKSIPICLQNALSIGLGCLLVFIGLKNANIIVSDPETYVVLGHFSPSYAIALVGIFLAAALFINKKTYALLAPIIIITVIAYLLGITKIPQHIFSKPDFSLFNTIDILGSLKYSLVPVIFSIFLVSYFDATTATLALISQIDLPSEQIKQKLLRRTLISEPIGSIFSSFAGTANGIIYIESSSGIQLGARTGLAALITGLLFIPFLFLSPIVNLIPLFATTPTLVLVGFLMIDHGCRYMSINNLEESIAVLLTVMMIPLTFSVASGAVFGILGYVIIKLLLGKYKEVSLAMLLIALVCCSWFFI